MILSFREACKNALGEQYINNATPSLDDQIMEENAKNYTRRLKFLNVFFDEVEGKEKEGEVIIESFPHICIIILQIFLTHWYHHM